MCINRASYGKGWACFSNTYSQSSVCLSLCITVSLRLLLPPTHSILTAIYIQNSPCERVHVSYHVTFQLEQVPVSSKRCQNWE